MELIWKQACYGLITSLYLVLKKAYHRRTDDTQSLNKGVAYSLFLGTNEKETLLLLEILQGIKFAGINMEVNG